MNKLIKDLVSVVTGTKKTLPADFSVQDVNVEAALRDELRKLVGSYKDYRRNQLEIFEILEEAFDEVVPNKIDAILGSFAEVRFFAQGQRPHFRMAANRMRGKQFVTRAALSGVYETFRLDRTEFDVPTDSIGGAAIVDFERYLDGLEDLMELYDIIVEGMTDYIYKLIQQALLASWDAAGRPAANKISMSSFDPDAMQELVNVVAAYGAPIIMAPPQFVAKMANFVSYPSANPNMPNQDLVDIRENGYIGKFRGTPIVVLPQSFEDETNAKFVMNPKVAYVIPAGKEKIVKIAFEGDTIVDEWKNRDRSMEIQAYRKLGVGIIANPNYWAIAQNEDIVADGWTDLAGSDHTAPADVAVTPTTFTVTYKANGGTGADYVTDVLAGSNYAILPNIFTAPGATPNFVEWDTAAAGTGTAYDPADIYVANADVTLYAIWSA